MTACLPKGWSYRLATIYLLTNIIMVKGWLQCFLRIKLKDLIFSNSAHFCLVPQPTCLGWYIPETNTFSLTLKNHNCSCSDAPKGKICETELRLWRTSCCFYYPTPRNALFVGPSAQKNRIWCVRRVWCIRRNNLTKLRTRVSCEM